MRTSYRYDILIERIDGSFHKCSKKPPRKSWSAISTLASAYAAVGQLLREGDKSAEISIKNNTGQVVWATTVGLAILV